MKYVFGSIITLLLLIVVLYYTLGMWGVELPIHSPRYNCTAEGLAPLLLWKRKA